MKNQIASVVLCSLLAACGSSSSSQSGNPADAQPENQNPGNPPQPEQNTGKKPAQGRQAPSEQVEKDAFLKTFASGVKTWNLKDAVVKVKTTDKKTYKVIEDLTLKCSTSISVKGSYPTVKLQMGLLKCDKAPFVLTELYYILGNEIKYSARHMPAGNIAPNQFRLNVGFVPNTQLITWESTESLNALTDEKFVFFDFLGKQVGEFRSQRGNIYYLDASIKTDGSKEKLVLSATVTDNFKNQETELKIETDLVRAND